MSSAKQYRATTTAWADSMAHSEGMSEWPAANLNNVAFVQPGDTATSREALHSALHGLASHSASGLPYVAPGTMTGELAAQGSFYEPVQPSNASVHPRLRPPFGLLAPGAAVDSFNEIHKGSRLGDSNIKTARASLPDAAASYNATWAVDDCEDLAEPRWQKSAVPCGGGGSASGLVTSSCYGRSELCQNHPLRHMCDVQAEAASKQGAVALLRQVVASMGMMDGTAMEAQDFNILLQQVLNARGGVKSGRVSNRSSSQAMATGGDDAMRYAKSSLYKTELCRSWEERGSCRYGAKCQFAHGLHELRPVQRHPKYKTQLCRTFASTGTCPYGKRCRFIHPSLGNTPNQQASLSNSPPPPPLQGSTPAALAVAAHASVPPLLELQQQLVPHADAILLPADPHGSSRRSEAAAGMKRLPVFQQLETSSYADDGSATQRGSTGSSSGARSSSPNLLLCSSSSSSSSSSRQWESAQGAKDGVGSEGTAASDSMHRYGSGEHSARFGAAPGVAVDSSPDGSSESCSSFFSHNPAVSAPGFHHLLPHLAFSAEQGQQSHQLRSLRDIPGRSSATTWAFSAAAGFVPKAAEPNTATQLSAVAHPPLPRAAASLEWGPSPELLAACPGLAVAPQGRTITMDVDKP